MPEITHSRYSRPNRVVTLSGTLCQLASHKPWVGLRVEFLLEEDVSILVLESAASFLRGTTLRNVIWMKRCSPKTTALQSKHSEIFRKCRHMPERELYGELI